VELYVHSPFCVNDAGLDSAEEQIHLAGVLYFLTCEERHFMQLNDGDFKN
jgi:hypothetical protein